MLVRTINSINIFRVIILIPFFISCTLVEKTPSDRILVVQDKTEVDFINFLTKKNDGCWNAIIREKDKEIHEEYVRTSLINKKHFFYKWYLSGRIYETEQNFNAAVLSYIKAEQYLKGVDDERKTWLFFAFERVYCKAFSFFNAFDSSKKALYYARKAGNMDDYGLALCDCACNAILLNKREDARIFLTEYKKEFGGGTGLGADYYRAKMVYHQYVADPDSALFYTRLYLKENVPHDLMTCIVTAVRVKNYDFADSLLVSYRMRKEDSSDYPAAYFMCRSMVRRESGDMYGAYEDLKKENLLINQQIKNYLVSDVSSLKDRYYLKKKSDKIIVTAVLIISLFTILVITLFVRNIINKNKILIIEEKYRQIQKDHDMCLGVSPYPKGLPGIEQSIREMGTSIGLSEDEDLSKICTVLANIIGTLKFVKNLTLMAEINCPRFYGALNEKGLSTYEIGYCCLLMLGFRTKELKRILNRTNVYNRNVEIRNKLEISDKNASIYSCLNEIYLSSSRKR